MIVRVTAPQAPRVLPILDAEIAQAAQQLNPDPITVTSIPPVRRSGSGCLVATLIVLGIAIFIIGSFYGVYHPYCPMGELVRTYPIAGNTTVFEPHCESNGVSYEVQEQYVLPGGWIVSRTLWAVGAGLFLWGVILPTVRWFQRRAEREQFHRQQQVAVNQLAARQHALEAQVARARARVDAAYYCGRDDGFFIPGYGQFFHRRDWAHFLFG
jgi:hypothetical protein